MVKVKYCLDALGLGLCYGLLFGFGGLLCFGIIVFVLGGDLCIGVLGF